MTWGQQNTEKEAHAQIEYALDHGVNFIDSAELYPVPPMAETQGRTEQYIGTWLRHKANRKKVIVGTKVAGPSQFEWIRGGRRPRFNRADISAAIEGSLKRLQTDYIDLYQLHWPERTTNYFGSLRYFHIADEEAIALQESLAVLQEFVKKGAIRCIGLSNETPWGVMESLRLHTVHGLPRVQSIQNPFSMLNRSFEVGLSEIAIREKCGLLAYSTLGFGILSGKYFSDQDLSQTRIKLWPEHFGRYSKKQAITAAQKYVALAKKYQIRPAQLAISFVEKAPFVTSCIIAATTLEQLRENIAAPTVEIGEELFAEINAIEDAYPFPAP